MVRMLVGLTVFFFLASFGQLFYLHSRIENAPQVKIEDFLSKVTLTVDDVKQDQLAEQKLRLCAVLEANLIARRYHQANVFLMSRVWTNYLGFVTGMTLALVGAAFVLGQLRSPLTEFESKADAVQLSLKTASPGITLSVLGVLLMMTTIIVHHDIETKDIPVYLGKDGSVGEFGKPPINGSPAPK